MRTRIGLSLSALAMQTGYQKLMYMALFLTHPKMGANRDAAIDGSQFYVFYALGPSLDQAASSAERTDT
jgi:hypothetical protein